MNAETLSGAIAAGMSNACPQFLAWANEPPSASCLNSRRRWRPAGAAPSQTPVLTDLQSALVNLGYKTKNVEQLMGELAELADSMSFEELLREALKKLRPK